jgi:16S rRNA (guanine527-N7)-methyltransferase
VRDPEPIAPPAGFLREIEHLDVAFDPGDLPRLGRYLALLLETNRQFNLTAVTDPDDAWTRHVADSLTLMPYLAGAEAKTVIDVGSGAGLPGFPLAIVLPAVRFTLLEATGKKARFLEMVVHALGLTNVGVLNDRAENLGRDREHHREQYDAVVARAVGRLPVLLELTVPLARVGGLVLAIKGEKAQEEIVTAKEALYRLHSRVVDAHRTATGTIIVIEKRRATPKLYPRRPGEPKRAPLGSDAARRWEETKGQRDEGTE